MIRQDYIMRMIEQIAIVISRLLHGQISRAEAQRDLAEACHQHVGIPWDVVRDPPASETLFLLSPGEELLYDRALAAAELTRLHGLLLEREHERETSLLIFEKSLQFYEAVIPGLDRELREDVAKKAAEMRAKLEASGGGLGRLRDAEAEEEG